MTTTGRSGLPVRGGAIAILVLAIFGFFWGLTGIASLPPPFAAIGLLVVFVITLAWVAVGLVFRRRATYRPSMGTKTAANPFSTPAYRRSVSLMVLGIVGASLVLGSTGFADAIVSVVALIVGLHFFGLIRAFDARELALPGSAMCLLGVLSLGLPIHVRLTAGGSIALRQTVVGVGCALILWGSLLGLTRLMWREARW